MIFSMQSNLLKWPFLLNDHLPTTVTFLADSPYMDSLNLYKMGISLQLPLSFVPTVAIEERSNCIDFIHVAFKN